MARTIINYSDKNITVGEYLTSKHLTLKDVDIIWAGWGIRVNQTKEDTMNLKVVSADTEDTIWVED